MGYIVISMPKQDNANKIKDVIKASGFWEDVITCTRGREILELVDNQEVNLVVCMRKLADMGYEELVSYLPGNVAVLLLTKDEALLPFSSSVTKMLMPLKPDVFLATLKTILGDRRKPGKKKFRTAEEQAVIDQAKQVLMKKNDMTEPEAYRYLQKMSMDTQRDFLETARMVLVLGDK